MFKNVAGQRWAVFAFQDEGGTNPGDPVTGDSLNITANVRIDGGAANALDDTNPDELEDGYYVFSPTQAEVNGDHLVLAPVSSTANVAVIAVPAAVYTRDWAAGDISAILVDTSTTLDGKLDTIDGIVDSILVDTGTTLETHLTDIKGAGFLGSTDSLEAIRNRGDTAWTPGSTAVHSGTAQAGSANTITLDAGASSTTDLYALNRVEITSGTGAGQSRAISAYNGTTKVATVVNNWAVNPNATSVFDIVFDAVTEVTAAPTAEAVADAVWNENTTGHTTAGTFGEQVKNDIDAILGFTTTLNSDWANGGRLDLILDAVLADTNELQTDDIPTTLATLATAADLATVDTVVDGIQTDLSNATDGLGAIKAAVDLGATAAALATVDTVVDAIKVVTDQMVFTKANELDVNTLSINSATVVGDGNATPWDGA